MIPSKQHMVFFKVYINGKTKLINYKRLKLNAFSFRMYIKTGHTHNSCGAGGSPKGLGLDSQEARKLGYQCLYALSCRELIIEMIAFLHGTQAQDWEHSHV